MVDLTYRAKKQKPKGICFFLVLFMRPPTKRTLSFDHFVFFCEEKLKKDIEGLIDPEEPGDGSARVGFLLDEDFAMSKVNDVWMYIYLFHIHDICSLCSKFGFFLLHVFGLFDYV